MVGMISSFHSDDLKVGRCPAGNSGLQAINRGLIDGLGGVEMAWIKEEQMRFDYGRNDSKGKYPRHLKRGTC
jgi:hypothetical protein